MTRFTRSFTPPSVRALCAAGIFAVSVGMMPPSVAAQDFSPIVIVNDEIITGYDVTQRMRLLEAASGGSAVPSREEVVEQLIDDVLRLQAAKAAGINPTPEQIDTGFGELARSNGRDAATMRQYFESRGVSRKSLDRQVAAEVAWRDLVPQTYLPRIRISDDQVADAMGLNDANSNETQYLISEIRLPIGAEGEQATLAKGREVLRQLTQGAVFGDVARQISQGSSAVVGGDRSWVSQSQLTPKEAQVLSAMKADRVSAPFVDGNEVVLMGLRSIREPKDATDVTYRLFQIVVGVAPDASQSIANLALEKARIARTRVTDCASADAIKGEFLPISGDLGDLTLAQMPGPVRETVATLETGGISDPVRSNDGFHIIIVCDKVTKTSEKTAEKDRMKTQLTAEKLGQFSQSLLRKLRREAVIERR